MIMRARGEQEHRNIPAYLFGVMFSGTMVSLLAWSLLAQSFFAETVASASVHGSGPAYQGLLKPFSLYSNMSQLYWGVLVK